MSLYKAVPAVEGPPAGLRPVAIVSSSIAASPAGVQPVPLLRTKLYIPPTRPGLVSRRRLFDRLEAGSHRKLALISAPAGFGKTTLVAEWACGSAREVAWLSLDEGDNDPVQFLQYLCAALQQVDGSIGQTLLPILRSPQFPPPQNLITTLVNDLSALDVALTLVLDDYHFVTSPVVHEMVRFLLEHQPPTVHLVLSTREDPPLPLVRMRARGQLTEVRERDLRFTPGEAARFLQQTMGLSLPPQAIEAIEARTEGWAAGLQLAALALQEDQANGQASSFATAASGNDRYVTEYLMTEVLQRQPRGLQDFMRETCILDRMTAPLCDAVTGRQDSQDLLERLASAHLFVSVLDNRHEWYRYYHLFAHVLRATLDREERSRLHRRAADWYERNGLMQQAVHHALAHAAAANDYGYAERLIRGAVEETIDRGSVTTVRGWLEALPQERVCADGELATYKAWILSVSGEMPQADEYARAAQACLSKEDAAGAVRGKLLSVRSFLALLYRQDYAGTIALAREALGALDTDSAHWRVFAMWSMAEAQERTSSITDAIETLWQARRIGRALDNRILGATVEAFLSTELHLYGQRTEAIAVCKDGIARHTDDLGRVSPVACLLYSQLGWLYYDANELETAQRYLQEGQALGEQLSLGSDLTFTLGRLGQTLFARGETAQALRAVQRAHQLAVQTGYVESDWPLALEATMRLRLGDIAFAIGWAERAGLDPGSEPEFLHLEQHLTYARLLLAMGRFRDARLWLARLERFLRARQLCRSLATVHVLQASAAAHSGERETARELLTRALQIAAPEALYRVFLDEDANVLALLPDVRVVAPRFVDQLLAYAGISGAAPERPTQPLVEPLSDREVEVLGLIAAGLANREIADELVIAIGTVKRHINHIYGKLGVPSRTRAIAKARELGLV